jgi:hypothetical protein
LFGYLHVLKRIRYRFVYFDANTKVMIEVFFLSRVRAHVQLQPLVYQNAKVTKMHDSPPSHPFSQRTTCAIFAEDLSIEFFVFFPWFLIVSALTFWQQWTRTRCSLLETAFWILWIYDALSATGKISPDLCLRTPRRG